MKRHHEADERQRIVHLLVRELGEESGAVEHLDAEDLAGLVSGSLLKTEIGRVENHLLACADCRRRAIAMQNDFEAGVVPILLRRATARETGGRLMGPRLPRRWTPWILGAAAAVLAVLLPLTEVFQFGSSRREVTELSFVFRRLGNPKLGEKGGGKLRPAAPGSWVMPGQEIDATPGDYLEALRADGSVWGLVEGNWTQRDPGDLTSQRIFERAAEGRLLLEELAEEGPSGAVPSAQKPRIVHPLGRIHDLRPPLRWAGGSGEEFEIRIYDEAANKLLFSRREDRQAIHWPDEVLPLKVGGRYRIELLTRPFSGPPDAKARFEIISAEERERVDAGLERVGALVGRGPSVLRAEFLRHSDLHAEEREELERLRQSDSENVEILIRLKVAFRQLGLVREESRTRGIIEKRR